MQQQRAIVITTQMETSTIARMTTTRMNSVKESARKKPPLSGTPSVVLEPLTDSESEDDGSAVVLCCPCAPELPLLPLLLTINVACVLLNVGVVRVVVVTISLTMKDTRVQVLLIDGKLCSASWMSSSVAFTGRE